MVLNTLVLDQDLISGFRPNVLSHWQTQIYFTFSVILLIDSLIWQFFIVRCLWSIAAINYTASYNIITDVFVYICLSKK